MKCTRALLLQQRNYLTENKSENVSGSANSQVVTTETWKSESFRLLAISTWVSVYIATMQIVWRISVHLCCWRNTFWNVLRWTLLTKAKNSDTNYVNYFVIKYVSWSESMISTNYSWAIYSKWFTLRCWFCSHPTKIFALNFLRANSIQKYLLIPNSAYIHHLTHFLSLSFIVLRKRSWLYKHTIIHNPLHITLRSDQSSKLCDF